MTVLESAIQTAERLGLLLVYDTDIRPGLQLIIQHGCLDSSRPLGVYVHPDARMFLVDWNGTGEVLPNNATGQAQERR